MHIHAYIHLGVEIIRGVHNYDPNVPIVLTLHEYLAICNQNGQMVKRGSHKLCYESSPIDCNNCFAEHSPADFFLRKRFIQSFFSLVDQFGLELGVEVQEPELFCNPVDKNGEGFKDPRVHLTCYEIDDDSDSDSDSDEDQEARASSILQRI